MAERSDVTICSYFVFLFSAEGSLMVNEVTRRIGEFIFIECSSSFPQGR